MIEASDPRAFFEPPIVQMTAQAAVYDRSADAAEHEGDHTAGRMLRAGAEALREGRNAYMAALDQLFVRTDELGAVLERLARLADTLRERAGTRPVILYRAGCLVRDYNADLDVIEAALPIVKSEIEGGDRT